MAEKEVSFPSIDVLEKELARERYRRNYSRVLRSTVFSLLVVAAIAVLIAVLLMPVIQVSGMSMADTLNDGDIIVALKGVKYTTGDVIAFYYNNNILIKRVIARPGDWINIDSDGNVSVNDVPLDEPYVTDKAFGDCNIPLPYQVPEGRFFLMGDHRGTSIDSRNSAVGCISDDMVVGKLFVRVWPYKEIGLIY